MNTNMTLEGRVLDPLETARALKIAKKTLMSYVKAGKIPVIRCSRKTLRFDLDAVMAALTTKTEP